jgi:Ni/Co efflux regulator RcnB
LETNVLTFSGNWAGTGEISGANDAEKICMDAGEYMESGVVNTGNRMVELDQNHYAAGDTIKLEYRHDTTEVDCLLAAWNDYTIPFLSLGYVQVRIESTL